MSLYNVVGAASLVAGQPEDVSQVLANFQAIQTILNGGIDNTNINAAAAIAATKLSGYPSDATKFLRGDNTWSVAIRNVTPTVILNGTVLYTTPTGTSEILVEALGAGGGGGGTPVSAAGTCAVAGSGGGGAFSAKFIQAPLASYACAVGGAGTGGAVTPTAGGVGGDTTFNVSTVIAKGGLGGIAGTQGGFQVAAGVAGGAAASGAGDVVTDGPASTAGWASGATIVMGCCGNGGNGGGPWGGAGAAGQARGSGIFNGIPGKNFGGGGGGGITVTTATATTGGAGANGLIVVWNFS